MLMFGKNGAVCINKRQNNFKKREKKKEGFNQSIFQSKNDPANHKSDES